MILSQTRPDLALSGPQYYRLLKNQMASGYQPLDPDLTAIAALTTSSYGRGLLTQGDATSARSYLGAGTGTGTGTVTDFSAGDLSPLFTTSEATTTTTPALTFALSNAAANTFFGNGTGGSAAPTFMSASTARTALGLVIGTNVQAYNADLTAWAAITPGSGWATLLAATKPTTLSGYGISDAQASDPTLTAFAALTIAADSLTIGTGADAFSQTSFAANTFPAKSSTGNLVAKTITDFGLSLVDDASASNARATLGLVIGTDVQAYDSDLVTIAGLAATTDNFMVSVASAWASRTPSQVRTTLALVIGTNVQAWDADLDTWSGITPASGIGTFLAAPSSANLISAITDETGSGALVFATSPTLVSPLLGTPTSGILTNCSGTAASLTAGNATKLTTGRTLAITGDLTWASPFFDGSGNVTAAGTIANSAVTVAKMANMATASLIYRKTAGSGAPEVNTLATLKTDLLVPDLNATTNTIPKQASSSSFTDSAITDDGTDLQLGVAGQAYIKLSYGGDITKVYLQASNVALDGFLITQAASDSGSLISTTNPLFFGLAASDLYSALDKKTGTVGATSFQGPVFAVSPTIVTPLISGKLTSYNGVTTSGWGIPIIQKATRATAQTAVNASVATYTCGAADGSFEVSANILVTTATLHNFTATVSYTDEGNTARVVTMQFSTLAGAFVTAMTNAQGAVPYEGVPLHIRVKASTAITIGTTGTFTSVAYNVEGIIRQLA